MSVITKSDPPPVVASDDVEKGTNPLPTSDEASSIRSVTPGGDNEAVTTPPTPPTQLPFSKGRCIALVLTVTGAAFLNVSPSLVSNQYKQILLTWTLF